MKSHNHTKTKKSSSTTSSISSVISLGDLVAAVSAYAKNERETLAAIQDLFRRGSVVAQTAGGRKRLRLA